MTTRQLRAQVRRAYPGAVCARWRILGHCGATVYRVTTAGEYLSPVCASARQAWQAVEMTKQSQGTQQQG